MCIYQPARCPTQQSLSNGYHHYTVILTIHLIFQSMNKGSASSWLNQIHSPCIHFFLGSIISPFPATRKFPWTVKLLGTFMCSALPLQRTTTITTCRMFMKEWEDAPWEHGKVGNKNAFSELNFQKQYSIDRSKKVQIQLQDWRLIGLSLLTVILLKIATLLNIVKRCVDQTGGHVCHGNTGNGEPKR